MGTFALSRSPSRAKDRSASLAFGRWLLTAFRRRMQAGKDRRVLQNLPDYVLADMGLEKIEFRSAVDGRRDVWVIPHRYY